MTLTFGSLFAGVGGFDLGFEAAGYECKFQVEWDKNCQQTLGYLWPDVPRWSDVSEVNGADLPPVDVITYGFPCQDLSVAGKRAGLDGERSHLFFEAVRIITEMREATDGKYPTWAVAENVAGLLNADRGLAMARVVEALAEAGSLVIEWALLDAQWFGVPQRRRRVFVASCFDPATAGRCPTQIFPVAKSGSRNPKEILKERQEVAGTLGGGSGSRGWSPDTDRMTFIPTDGEGLPFTKSGYGNYSEGFGTLSATDHKRPEQHVVIQEADEPKPIAFSHTQGLDIQPSEDHFPTLRTGGAGHAVAVPFVKSARVRSDDTPETWIDDAPNPTLNSFDQGDIRTTTAIVFHPHYHDGARIQNDVMNTLTSRMGTGGNNVSMVAQPMPTDDETQEVGRTTNTVVFEPKSMLEENWASADVKNTLRAGESKSAHVIVHDAVPTDEELNPGVAATLRSGGDGGIPSSRGEHLAVQPLGFSAGNSDKAYGIGITEDGTPPIRAGASGTNQSPTVMTSELAVRRLTPLECERLQGWPDNHTLNRADGKQNADSTRYKMCGNGVAAPVAKWVAKHLAKTFVD
jgi:site-specific DNA-cytosine methylase